MSGELNGAFIHDLPSGILVTDWKADCQQDNVWVDNDLIKAISDAFLWVKSQITLSLALSSIIHCT